MGTIALILMGIAGFALGLRCFAQHMVERGERTMRCGTKDCDSEEVAKAYGTWAVIAGILAIVFFMNSDG